MELTYSMDCARLSADNSLTGNSLGNLISSSYRIDDTANVFASMARRLLEQAKRTALIAEKSITNK